MNTVDISQRRWLNDENPTMRYYIELADGRRGESDTALQLCDLVINQDYSDCEDRETQIMLLGKKMKDVAAFTLATEGVRAQVFSGVGLFFDNGVAVREDEIKESSSVTLFNREPVILDFWDEWTVIASLIKIGYLKLYEKAHLIPVADREELASNLVIFDHMFGTPVEDNEYWLVDSAQLAEPTWKQKYVILANR